ncbi:unnamed protein product [Brachionus calyciflorus]|uniref:Uncharacterized protein n=1 Tax=Brachionus calyciflorus TaxID=104777 RepID=A0A814ALZ3_9BILA|nr:unnamed protein product [Brachionus calyciflorus]
MNWTNSTISKDDIKIHYSLNELSLEIIDLANIYVLPIVCLIGIILNFLSTFVLFKLRAKSELYKFMLSISISDFLFLLLSIFLVIIRCGRFCQYGYTYISKFYELYFYLYLGNIFLMFVLLVNLLICYNRITSFSKHTNKTKFVTFKVKIICVIVIATLANVPNYVMTRQVKKIGVLRKIIANETSGLVFSDMDLFSVESFEFSKINWVKVVLFIFNLGRGFILMIILFVFNLAIAIKLKMYLNSKSKRFGLKAEKSSSMSVVTDQKKKSTTPERTVAEYKFTIMTLIFGTFYLIGNLPNSLAPMLFLFIIRMSSELRLFIIEHTNGIINKIDLHVENILIHLDQSSNHEEIEEINRLRLDYISKVREVESYNLENINNEIKLKYCIFISNSPGDSKVKYFEYEPRISNFPNKLGCLVIYNQSFDNATTKILKNSINKPFKQYELSSIKEFAKLYIFIDLITNYSSNKFIDLTNPAKNQLTKIKIFNDNFEAFESSDLDFLPKFLNLKLINSFWLTHTQIKYLPRGIFTHLNYITEFYLESCHKLEELLPNGFQNLVNLNEMTIHDCGLVQIDKYAFNGLTHLTHLNLSNNKIETIEEGAFDELINLKYLYLNNNKIGIIKQETFKMLRNLLELHLFFNSIKYFEDGWSSGLDKLLVLKIHHNQNDISFNTLSFDSLDSLKWLDLYKINTVNSYPNLSDGLRNLEILNVKKTIYDQLYIYEKFKNLQVLNLVKTERAYEVEYLNKFRFDNIKYLKFEFQTVPKLSNFQSLQALSIIGVHTFENDCFENLKNLKYLKISFICPEFIHMITDKTLKYFSNLKYFEIDNNLKDELESAQFFKKIDFFISKLFNSFDDSDYERIYQKNNGRTKIVINDRECDNEKKFFSSFIDVSPITKSLLTEFYLFKRFLLE